MNDRFDELLDYLEEQNVNYTADEERGIVKVYINARRGEKRTEDIQDITRSLANDHRNGGVRNGWKQMTAHFEADYPIIE